jgi:hypothetical protein
MPAVKRERSDYRSTSHASTTLSDEAPDLACRPLLAGDGYRVGDRARMSATCIPNPLVCLAFWRDWRNIIPLVDSLFAAAPSEREGGEGENKRVPSEAIVTIPSYAQWVPFPTSRTCYRRTLARRSYLYSERFRVCSKDSPTARRQADRERKEKPRVSGAKFGGTSNVRTAHAATIDKRRVAMRLCSRCDGDHKNALFARRRADLGVEILASIWLPFAQLS